MKKYKIEIGIWSESLSGYVQCDGKSIYYIEATSEEAAKNKVSEKILDLSKGNFLSHNKWVEFGNISLISGEEWKKMVQAGNVERKA